MQQATPEELEIQSIPTDVELLTRGNFDDLGHKDRTTPDDSKILSSILLHDSSHYQSYSALSMVQNHYKQTNDKSIEPFTVSEMDISKEKREDNKVSHQGFVDKPISFGKDFVGKDLGADSAQKHLMFRKNTEASSPAQSSLPSPQFEN